MDSTGVTRQARLETRSTAGDPITLDLAYSACARGLTGSRDTGQSCKLWPVAADSCDELTPGSATPTLHKVRAEVDGGQALTGGTNETVAIFDAVDGAHDTRSRRELTPSPCLPRTGSAVT